MAERAPQLLHFAGLDADASHFRAKLIVFSEQAGQRYMGCAA